jgi:type IV secretion system protein TrbL
VKQKRKARTGFNPKTQHYGAFSNMGLQILIQVFQHVSVFQPIVATGAILLAILILIVLGLITANILLVVVESYVVVYAGLIFLAFGAMEWSRDMSIGYYKTILAYGIKLMATLLLAGIGLSILLFSRVFKLKLARGGGAI